MDIRWKVLVCCCIISFAQDFFYDEPSSLVQRLTGSSEACMDKTDSGCLDLDMTQFNLFFSVYAWCDGTGAVLSGWAIDQYGWNIPLWISSFLIFLGALMFPAGSYASTTSAAFGWMITSRVVFGLGSGAIVVINHRMKASWFQFKELGLAFSLHILSGRIGSALSYLIFGSLVGSIGLRACLWLGFCVGLLACFSIIALTRVKERSIHHEESSPKNLAGVWTFLTSLDGVFWGVAGAVLLFYGTVATYTANGAALMAALSGYSESVSSYIVGLVYDVCLLSPIVGWLIDRYGHRDYWISGATITLLFALLVFLIPKCPGWLLSVLVGVAFGIFPATVWSSLPLIVPSDSMGLANGLLKFVQYVGTGVLTTLGGVLLDAYENTHNMRWRDLILYLIGTSAVAVVFALVVNILNRRTGHRLTPSQLEREKSLSSLSTLYVQEVMPLLKEVD